jgi:hypothetical protein
MNQRRQGSFGSRTNNKTTHRQCGAENHSLEQWTQISVNFNFASTLDCLITLKVCKILKISQTKRRKEITITIFL